MPNRELWMGVGKQVLSFVVGVIVAAFILGRNSQRINDVVNWKHEVAPRIERMDRQGTLSFELFHQVYNTEQAKQYARLERLEDQAKGLWEPARLQKLEDEVNHIDQIEFRLSRLEREVQKQP